MSPVRVRARPTQSDAPQGEDVRPLRVPGLARVEVLARGLPFTPTRPEVLPPDVAENRTSGDWYWDLFGSTLYTTLDPRSLD